MKLLASQRLVRARALWVVLFFVVLTIVLWSKEIPVTAQSRFSDIRGHWAQSCIESLAQRNIINGYPDQRFRPETGVTRAEYAVMVGKALPQMSPLRSGVDFIDVPPQHWAYSAIQAAYKAGFLSGYPGGRFQPTEKMVRVQAIGALAGGLGYKTRQATPQDAAFGDADRIPAYAKGAIAAATDNGLVVNYPNVKQLRPNEPITRAELASTLCRALPEYAALVPTQYVAGLASVPVSNLPRSELRGAWITNVDSEVMFDQSVMVQAIRELAQLNFNTLYPTVWNWGYTQYPSEVAGREIGKVVDPRVPGLQNRDFLAEMVEEGHKQGLAVIPWFEFGFMITAESELRTKHPDWITQRRDGTQIWMETIYQRSWLNPFKPEVQQFIQDLVLELVTKYDLDGIQLDDHFGLPYEFGYDPYTVALYQSEHGGKSPPANPKDAEWVRWRANKITEFTARLFKAVKAQKEQVLFTLSPNNYDFSLKHSLQDWLTWERQGLIEELILQAYRDDLGAFMRELQAPEVQEARRHIPVAIGILSGLKDRPVPIQQVRQQVQAVRQSRFEGMSFFFYETMWNLSREASGSRKAVFQELFTARMPRPNIKQGWVPSA
jgi:uncharacterized lipoprotein YddW (UPF0748 family)